MKITGLTGKNGVKNLITFFDQMYLKDGSAQAYEAYETFEKLVRPYIMLTVDCIIKFEKTF